MGWIIFCAFLMAVLYFAAGGFSVPYGREKNEKKREIWLSILCLVFAVATLVINYNMIAKRHSDGAPMAEIGIGAYKVAHVYVAEDRVSVLIEKPENDGSRHLYLCQFSVVDLASGIPRVAEKSGIVSRAKWLEIFKTPDHSAYSGGSRSSKKYKLTE